MPGTCLCCCTHVAPRSAKCMIISGKRDVIRGHEPARAQQTMSILIRLPAHCHRPAAQHLLSRRLPLLIDISRLLIANSASPCRRACHGATQRRSVESILRCLQQTEHIRCHGRERPSKRVCAVIMCLRQTTCRSNFGDGSFLVRTSPEGQAEHHSTVSVVHEGKVHHFRIYRRPSGRLSLNSPAQPRGEEFETIGDLLLLCAGRGLLSDGRRVNLTHFLPVALMSFD